MVWKKLAHRNVAPLLGVTVDPIQLISDWMSGGDLVEYIANSPGADRVDLVSVLSASLYETLTPSLVI